MKLETIAVVGASLAGLRSVETLRQRGFAGRLTLVGAESHLPYDRPPLSKEVLQGKWGAEQTQLRKPDSWAELELDLRLGCRATALDLDARELEIDSRERLAFDGLVIATGALPRRLPGTPELDGIFVLRDLDDALGIAKTLERSPRVCVIGAGFIGLEVAASCRARGLDVTVLEVLDVPLEAAIGDAMGRHVAKIHRDRGVDLRLGARVEAIEGAGQVERVKLAGGETIPCDLLIVGIGVAPATGWLRSSGLALDDGIVCDASCKAAPGVYAAGDVARWQDALRGRSLRVEHWMNASEQGAFVAERLLAGPDDGAQYRHVPFFWSDQFDQKIQFAGHAAPGDALHIAHGTPEEGRFVALYGRGGRLVGALGFNRARRLIGYRRALEAGLSWDEAVAQAES